MQYERINNLNISITVRSSYTIRRQTYDVYNVLKNECIDTKQAQQGRNICRWEKVRQAAPTLFGRMYLPYAFQLTLLSSALQAEFLRQGPPGPSHHAVLHTQDEVLKKHWHLATLAPAALRNRTPHSAPHTAHRTPGPEKDE